MKPHMEDNEILLFAETIKEAEGYFEFGCGGSTVFASNNSSAKIHSVDSSKEWLNKVSGNIRDTEVILEHVNLGPLKAWGYPVTNKHLWRNYYESIHTTKVSPDVVLIDGRFRVSCALNVIKYSKNNNLNTTIMIHDSERYLKDLKKYLIQIRFSQSLSVMKIKDNINFEEIERDSERFKYQKQ